MRSLPFTSALSQKYGLTTNDLEKLQFYTAAPITLTREVNANHKVGTSMGKLVERQDEIIEEINIPAGTPGVNIETKTVETSSLFGLIKNSHQVMWLSFEDGTALLFGGYENGRWAPSHNDGVVTWATTECSFSNRDTRCDLTQPTFGSHCCLCPVFPDAGIKRFTKRRENAYFQKSAGHRRFGATPLFVRIGFDFQLISQATVKMYQV